MLKFTDFFWSNLKHNSTYNPHPTCTHRSAIHGLSPVLMRQHDKVWRLAKKGKCFLGSDVWQEISENWCRVNRHWQPPHLSKWSCESCSADMGQWREMCRFITSVCVCASASFRGFFVCELFMCLSTCIHSIWFLGVQCWLPRWSWAARTKVVVLRQRAGNLNLHIPCLQLPDVLPQEPGLPLHLLRFVPHPAEH